LKDFEGRSNGGTARSYTIPRKLVGRILSEESERLQNQALVLLLLLCQECSPGSRFEDFADAVVGFGRAFEVFVGTDLLAHFLALLKQQSVDVPKSFLRYPKS
jgi:hypothetical protein